MAQNSECMCKKIRNAVSSPLKATIRHISPKPHQPRDSSPKLSKSKGSARTSAAPNKPVQALKQSKTIHIELEPPIVHDFPKRDIVIASGQDNNGQKASIPFTKKDARPHKQVTFAKAKTKKDDDLGEDHEGKFSDYISKVKKRMIKTMSNVGGNGGGGGRIVTRRDSFNDKVMDYINHAKTKIRTTTIVENQNASFK